MVTEVLPMCSMNCLKGIRKKLQGNFIPSAFFCSSSVRNVLNSGQILKLSRKFADSDVKDYSNLSLDSNPLHFNSECAKKAGFVDRPVPGILVASLFPRIIAHHFPGAVYVSQNLQFKLPVYIGEEINAEVQATLIREIKSKYMAKFTTKCFKDGDILVIDGEAMAILDTLETEHT